MLVWIFELIRKWHCCFGPGPFSFSFPRAGPHFLAQGPPPRLCRSTAPVACRRPGPPPFVSPRDASPGPSTCCHRARPLPPISPPPSCLGVSFCFDSAVEFYFLLCCFCSSSFSFFWVPSDLMLTSQLNTGTTARARKGGNHERELGLKNLIRQ
jgi:hypothetical protein